MAGYRSWIPFKQHMREVLERRAIVHREHIQECIDSLVHRLRNAGFVLLTPEDIERENEVHERALQQAWDDGDRAGFAAGKKVDRHA